MQKTTGHNGLGARPQSGWVREMLRRRNWGYLTGLRNMEALKRLCQHLRGGIKCWDVGDRLLVHADMRILAFFLSQ
jgi:hypothetical protein